MVDDRDFSIPREAVINFCSFSVASHLSRVFFNPFSLVFFGVSFHTGDRFARARRTAGRVSINFDTTSLRAYTAFSSAARRTGECHCEICVPYGMFLGYRALKTF